MSSTLRHLLTTHPVDREKLCAWLRQEVKFWRSITDKAPSALDHHNEFSSYLQAISRFATSTADLQLKECTNAGHELLRLADEYTIIQHDHKLAPDFIEAASTPSNLRLAIFAYRSDNFFATTTRKSIYESQNEKLTDELDSAVSSTVQKMVEQEERYQKTLVERHARLYAEIKNDISEAKKTFSEMLEIKEKELKDISLKMINNIASNEPVHFWETKSRRHKTRALIFSIVATILALSLVALVATVLAVSHSKTASLTIAGIAIPDHFLIATVLLSITFGIWALKIIIKLMLSNINLESEAIERSTMIKTYVALSETSISDEVRTIFHKSLMTLSSNRIEDDTAPDALKAIELILKRK